MSTKIIITAEVFTRVSGLLKVLDELEVIGSSWSMIAARTHTTNWDKATYLSQPIYTVEIEFD